MKFLVIYMLVSAMVLAILIATDLVKFEWSVDEASFKNGLITILYLLMIILVWPIVVLTMIIIAIKDGRR